MESRGWLRWLFLTKDGKVVIGQFPNAPLIAALAADIVSYATSGPIHALASRTAQVCFAIWAGLEIGWGVNPFRRILGAIALSILAFAVFKTRR